MAAQAKGGARRKKDQEMAAALEKQGIWHGRRFHPWYQGINYPHLSDVGSAAYRRARGL
ncbi:hypothetical protein MINTM005_13900 [Mycobacterium intracellulare]|nr:hypothetical protein MINTM005_13900 [Mycobacterium intracellulare]